ncbi:MAG: ferrochelatase [Candidatus Margulisiibacteriota bacterium]
MSVGVLLINLGSPKTTDTVDVKSYLDEFLMDKYVIDLPYLLRFLLVKGIILNVRPKKSAEAYKSIWWDSGSPLIEISKQVEQKLSNISNYPMALAMRYAEPSIRDGIEALLTKDPSISDIIAVPLYPHYAMATTQTVVEKTMDVIRDHFSNLNVKFTPPFYDHKKYIHALRTQIQSSMPENTDYLLFSYHGVPVRHLKKTDPTKKHCYKIKDCCFIPNKDAHPVCYAHQVKRTTELVMSEISLPRDQWSWAFQSRLGLDEWLQPFADDEIERLAKSGIKHLAVCCPAFVSDCLETLEEIGEEGKEIFMEHGGESFTLIPCLNDHDLWIDALHTLINEQVRDQ